MNPYLMRNRTSSTSSQKTQSKEEAATTEAVSKTKNATNKTLKMKDPTKVTNTRSIIQAKSIAQNEKYRSMRKKKLSTEKIKTRSSSNMNKQELKDKERKIITRTKTISNLKQVSLKESFLNQSKMKCLRSHKNSKNSTNMLAKKSNVNKKKLLVYECVSPENSSENISEIYEFKWDINDSTEKIPKKRKKKIAVKKSSAHRKKNNIPIKQVSKKEPAINEVNEIKKVDSVESKNKNSVEPSNESRSSMLKEDLMENSKTNSELNKKSIESENMVKESTADKTITKPIIISIENLSDKKISIIDTSETLQSDDFKPFRPTNIFNDKLMMQQKNSLNYSLFEKSLSPITKSFDNPQINSPWRAPPLFTFSQMNNVFQSTPQNNKYDVNKKFSRTSNNESEQLGNPTKIKSILQKNNANITTEGYISTNTSKKKNSLTLRKFGTEITNIDHSLQFKSPVEQRNEPIISETENIQPNVQLTNAVTSNVINALKFDNNENKKNNVLTPKKNFKRNIIEVKAQIHQEDVSNIQADEQKENLDPQPGTSGLQNHSLANDQKALRQSNLNNFLNIMDMPQSTTIKTAHGVFDDIQSTPITSRALKKPIKSNLEVNTAFGFSDDDSDKEMSPNVHNVKNDKKEKAVQTNLKLYDIKPPAKLSIGEIKNKLLIKKVKEDIHNKENIITEKNEIKKSSIKKKIKQPIDIANFSDTFDVLSETGEIAADSLSHVSLFNDFEPSHFTEPPRHSYKRKREVKFTLPEEESTDEEERMREHEIKRKKPDKLKKEQEKRLMEWVQNIKKIFNEIDEHELVIE